MPRRIIFEFITVGNVLKVSAICEDTGTEVSIVGDPRASQKELEMVAARKLRYVMAKKDAEIQQRRRGIDV
ncbi:DUF6898 family protein [Kordiimonas sp.]|uniref:DUF6898 family protein n=1 Tax=Kordiimonas sp. TaxID=1970157 RepID=UPI003A8D8D78